MEELVQGSEISENLRVGVRYLSYRIAYVALSRRDTMSSAVSAQMVDLG